MARADLGANAHRGTLARPTVGQINRTLERLESIENLLCMAFATSEVQT
jgi:hypothetical protein